MLNRFYSMMIFRVEKNFKMQMKIEVVLEIKFFFFLLINVKAYEFGHKMSRDVWIF